MILTLHTSDAMHCLLQVNRARAHARNSLYASTERVGRPGYYIKDARLNYLSRHLLSLNKT